MDLKVNPNHKGYQTLLRYSQNKNMTIREVMLSDEHLDAVVDILYKQMPTMVRAIMKQEGFKKKYLAQREMIVDIFDKIPKKEEEAKK